MFAAPRFIAIDDNPDHLRAIQNALQEIGTSSFGIRYRPEDDLPDVFTGVRCLFVDLHLVSSVKTSDEKVHVGTIASIIDSRITPEGGPFLMVVWTAFPHLCDALEQYLNATLTGAKPLALLPLPKETYINVETGEVKDSEGLRAKVDELLNKVPQLAAMLEWEKDVLTAAGATLASVLTLVPPAQRDSKQYPQALDSVLSKLACAAVGPHNVAKDPRAALVQTLLPILTDRISNRWSKAGLPLWQTAITKHGDKAERAVPGEAGEVNRMMHLAPFGPEQFGPADWGSVVEFPFDLTDDSLGARFGVNLEAFFGEFKIAPADQTKVQPLLIRIGAVCDAAQRKEGPIPYLLGLKVPVGVKPVGKVTAAVWKSPRFAEDKQEFEFQINNRFELTSERTVCGQWKAIYRMREQLLMQLIAANAEYVSRPGIIKMD